MPISYAESVEMYLQDPLHITTGWWSSAVELNYYFFSVLSLLILLGLRFEVFTVLTVLVVIWIATLCYDVSG